MEHLLEHLFINMNTGHCFPRDNLSLTKINKKTKKLFLDKECSM